MLLLTSASYFTLALHDWQPTCYVELGDVGWAGLLWVAEGLEVAGGGVVIFADTCLREKAAAPWRVRRALVFG